MFLLVHTVLHHNMIIKIQKKRSIIPLNLRCLIQFLKLCSEELDVQIRCRWECLLNISFKLVFIFSQTRPSIHGGAAHEIRRRPLFD